ncbi:MAG: RNB domain-containing ribonuclease [Ruminococcaceae bacterium]|nr:RNB domain-containing ribonuclease [Oscillospiraceae bacterium]
MPIKERIINELKNGPKKYKLLKTKFKANKKFFAAMEELYQQGIIDEVNGLIILLNNKNEKKKQRPKDVFEGTVVKLTENYGFVRVEEFDKDVFVAGKFMMGTVVGDRVELRKIPSKRHQYEGEITAILEEKTNLVATVEKEHGNLYAVLRDCPILYLPIENRRRTLQRGDIIIVDIYGRGRSHRALTAKIKENLGQVSTSQKSVELMLAEKQMTAEFEPKVENEVNEVISRIDMATEYKYRKDLTDKVIFTIDSASTKDIDDAISIERTESGYNLAVHIADVSHFVKPASFVNQAAYNRGTSVYFGDSVIPMLPKALSNGACSLNEGEERLAFTCDMQLDNNGNVTGYLFYKSVIKSRLKGVYSEINDILFEDITKPEITKKYKLDKPADETAHSKVTPQLREKYSEVYDSIMLAMELYAKLNKKRIQRGAMDIESDEAYIVFDSSKKVIDVKKRERGESEKMIEEFMLLANGCSANLARKMDIPFVYRIHEEPDAEKMYTFKENLRKFGLKIEKKQGETLQTAFSRLLDKTRGTNLQQFVHSGVLRTQSKAKYLELPQGHFGLSLEDYAHFTSPIRRYPDLAIHRILTDVVNGVPKDKIKKKYDKFAKSAAKQSSDTELSAMQTERQATDIYIAEYMQQHIGEEFEGTVTSVMSFGVYVALPNTAEGLVHVSLIDMVNPILQEGFRLYCPITGKRYTIGDTVKIKVLGTDILKGNVDFEFVE